MSTEKEYVMCEYSTINELLGGGVRRGTTCLLEEYGGESRGVSGPLGISFLMDGVRRGEGAVILLSEHTVQEYYELPPVEELVDLAKPNQLIFMDGLSSLTFGEPTELTEENVVRCSNVRYAPKFYEEFRATMQNFDRARVFVDSLSVLLHAMESDRAAWRFWLTLLPLIRKRQLTIISAFYLQMHSPQFAESIERISDSIIRFSAQPSKAGQKPVRYIQVIKNRGLTFDDNIHVYTQKGYEFEIKSL